MSVRRIPAYCLPIAMFAAPVQAQSDNGMERACSRYSAEALAASEERVKTWFADPDVSAPQKSRRSAAVLPPRSSLVIVSGTMCCMKAGHNEQLKQNMLKYYAMAMGQEHGPAFARVGFLTESVEYGYARPGSGHGILRAGCPNWETVKPLPVTPASPSTPLTAGSAKMAESTRPTLRRSLRRGLGSLKRTELDKVYQEEKRAMVAKAVNYARVSRPKPGDEASHLLAGALQNGIPVPGRCTRLCRWRGEKLSLLELRRRGGAQWLLKPDMDEAIIQLSNMSVAGDILASRKLADIYLNGRSTDWQDSGRRTLKNTRSTCNARWMPAARLPPMPLALNCCQARKFRPTTPGVFEYLAKAALAGFGPAQVNCSLRPCAKGRWCRQKRGACPVPV